MFGDHQDKDRQSGGGRRAYLRSVSWSDGRSPPHPNPRPHHNNSLKGRSSCLPPLEPLSISRRKVEEWPKAGSDDLGVWPHPPTPRGVPINNSSSSNNSDSERPWQAQPQQREFQLRRDKLAFFDKECSRVADHVYLGSDAVARNREILRKNGITHVLNCVGFVCPEYFKSDLVYKTLWLQDTASEDITSILYDVFDYFEDVREHGGRVLVHCCQGVSRSTSLVIAYLMWREGQSFEDAFQCVKAARGVTNPNMGFACQLLQAQKRVLAAAMPASPNSVPRVYRMAPHSSYDPLHLVPKLQGHPGPIRLDSRGAFVVHVPTAAIYVWIGAKCDPVMANNAAAAAAQVVRYERAQGPIVTVREGEEPREFWDAFKEEGKAAAAVPKEVCEYDRDFEIFSKALAGGVVPAVSMSGTGTSETCLPARENGWGRLRRKLTTCGVKELVGSSESDMIIDDCINSDADENPVSSPTDDPRTDESPKLPSRKAASLSCLLASSPRFSSKSPSVSPSTSDYSTSSSSLNWSDQSHLSSQTSPSGPESVDLLSAKEDSDCPACQSNSRTSPSLPSFMEAFPASPGSAATDRCWSCRTPPSIAERRGMLLPSVDEASQDQKKNMVKSWSFSLPDLGNEMMVDAGFHEPNRAEPMLDTGIFKTTEKLQCVIEDKREDDRAILELYRWPSMEKVEASAPGSLDSRCVYIMFTQDMSLDSNNPGIVYIWVGSSVALEEGQWESIGHQFLNRMGLPRNASVQVVKQSEGPEHLLNNLQSLRSSEGGR